MEYQTSKIRSNSYCINDIGKNTLGVSRIYFPMSNAGNNVETGIDIKISPKRVWIREWETRDNWNGSGGGEIDRRYFSHMQYRIQAQHAIEKANELLKVENKDDDFEVDIKEFVENLMETFSYENADGPKRESE